MDYFQDSFYQEEDMFWDLIAGNDKNVNIQNRSAFRPYVKETAQRMILPASSKVNMKKRMVGLLRKNWSENKNSAVPEKERNRRHMMKERSRREKQKHSYSALHSLLPFASKKDKNSVVEKGVEEIKKLQRLKQELERRHETLEAESVKDHNDDDMRGTKVKFNLQEPFSGLDSMLEVLQCLKSMGAKIKTVNANFSNQEFSTTMNIDTQMRGEEVEKRVETRLQEAEWKLLFAPEASFFQ